MPWNKKASVFKLNKRNVFEKGRVNKYYFNVINAISIRKEKLSNGIPTLYYRWSSKLPSQSNLKQM